MRYFTLTNRASHWNSSTRKFLVVEAYPFFFYAQEDWGFIRETFGLQAGMKRGKGSVRKGRKKSFVFPVRAHATRVCTISFFFFFLTSMTLLRILIFIEKQRQFFLFIFHIFFCSIFSSICSRSLDLFPHE